jgi:hypothetical protein
MSASEVSADDLGSNLGPAPESPAKAKKAAKGMPERVWILLEDNDEIPPTGLYLGHNGTGYLLIPGEPVPVPDFILDILDHAVVTMPVTDPKTKRVVGHRERMRFPYRRVAAPEITE